MLFPSIGFDGGAQQSLTTCTGSLVQAPAVLDAKAVAQIAYAAGWRGGDLNIAVAIAKAESGWSATAKNENSDGSTDFGLFQINSVHQSILAGGNWADPNDNARMAHQVWEQAGGSWSPWVTYWRGTYKQYMDEQTVTGCATTNLTDPGKGSQGPDGLRPRAENIKAITTQRWHITDIGGYSYRFIAGTGTLSDHATGRAVDIMLGSDYKSPQKRAEGFEISRFFAANAKTLGIKYVIYYDQINEGSGWKPYGHPSGLGGDVFQHRNHVHVSVF